MLFVNIIVPVFIIIFSGWALERFSKIELHPLTTSSLYLFAPMLVLSALLKKPIESQLAMTVFGFMAVYILLMWLLAHMASRLLRLDYDSRQAMTLTTVMMNIGNFGLPLSYFAFGDAGLNVSILVFVAFNIPLGSLAIVIAQGKNASLWAATKNCLKIPILHAVVIALILNALHIKMPVFILRPMELLGQPAVPMMLVLLGMQMSRTQWRLPGGFMLTASFLRLCVAPVIGWTCCWILGITGIERNVMILQTSTPSAVLPLLYALRFNTRPDLVASTIMTTTLLSAGSLTLLLYLLPLLP
ncbi:AEC family transporter [Desulfuromonas acetoxidans]|uniref:Auxin Efflux Carrier n=1 Tax=Desulfuromonas acetoxidans (strain DSM 684 / 11070) TaxID=281689 RepID=Q1K1D1_DESA6|nr:AEC family transporter [Desulfuromonas acetoxidans]EAT16457.1 Auxin Efflux Carrier [Desulfuromonas acetoxidans DSM 684]MBF0644403.1 AEC family transporter [Desulfuromonas acetoxidans]NVD23597.1 AEC family transporter [Desulfuromonas acetoxidans]NVE16018.1 AEC family transporter [Desulfuromonas acetoxidans]